MIYCYYKLKKQKTQRVFEFNFPLGKAPERFTENGDVYVRDHGADFGGQQFILKGGGWPGQDIKRKSQMTRNNVEAGRRTRDRWGKPAGVVPNYKGKVTESWEAASHEAQKDKEK